MKKFVILGIIFIIVFFGGIKIYQIKKIKNAIIIVQLQNDLNIEFATNVKISDLITNINGKIIDDKNIDTLLLGEKEVKFEYINDQNIKIPYSFKINVVDKIAPLVWLKGAFTVDKNFEGELVDKIICADNYDDEPSCHIEGYFDRSQVGKYNLKFLARDSSGNISEIPFVLNVVEPKKVNNNLKPKTLFKDVVATHKSENTAIGIDVSKWQGDIDFEKVKESGVEFVFIRVGTKNGRGQEYVLDPKFEQNVKGFSKVGIPIGVYFYTYAQNEEESIKDAKWVIDKIKNKKIDLPIVYDFEDWNNYNKYKMSLYRLNRNAEVFIKTVEKYGYEGMIYGSKNYLESFWNTNNKNIWLAHYVNETTYKGNYNFWQLCNNGKIAGINGDVDINVMYK